MYICIYIYIYVYKRQVRTNMKENTTYPHTTSTVPQCSVSTATERCQAREPSFIQATGGHQDLYIYAYIYLSRHLSISI